MSSNIKKAPECLLEHSYSSKSDVWAYALLLVEIYSRQDIYPNLSGAQVAAKVVRGELVHDVPKYTPPKIGEVMKSCWAFYAKDRPDMKLICNTLAQL